MLKDVSLIDKADNHNISLNPSLINLKDILLNIIEENKQVYGPDFTIATKFILNQSEYFIDPDGIRYIIGNILSNAFKYSGNSQKIQFTVIEKNGEIVFNIVDFGIGIPEGDQKKLFEPFYRAPNAEGIPGTGFGLNIVKRFIDLCEGNIEFNSKIGKGTSVTINLPYKKKL